MRASSAMGIQAVGPGAAPGLDALFETHYVRLVRAAWLLLGDAGRAEELVQDAFVDLCQRRRSFGSAADAGGYLYVAVVNRARSALRHRRVVQTALERLENRPGSGHEASADVAVLHDAERRRVLAALDRLPRRQREVLVLRHYAELSEAETAEVLGIGRGSVKSHTSRGLRALRPLLEGRDDDH